MSQAGGNSSASGSGGSGILTLTGNSGGAVGPDGGGNVGLVGSGTVTVTGSPGTNTLTIGVSGTTWIQTSINTAMMTNTSYICISPGGTLSMQLPAVSSVGDIVEIALFGATAIKVIQGIGQSIVFGNFTTTVGVTGSLQSSDMAGTSVRLLCVVANTTWMVLGLYNFGAN